MRAAYANSISLVGRSGERLYLFAKLVRGFAPCYYPVADMGKPPRIEAITEWLHEKRPLGITNPITVKDIDPKPWSGHFNFLVAAPERKFLLRFTGPEWGEPTQGIIDEYENLKILEPYAVGPRVFGLERDFFGEPALFMEYLEGQPLNAFSPAEQLQRYPEAVELILKINRVPYRDLNLRLGEPCITYERSKRAWQRRLAVIEQAPKLKEWASRLRELLPQAEAMLDRFEPRLERVLKTSGPVLLFLSAHIGHCLVTPAGLRFINWEEVCIGDPSFTLAVFLASVSTRDDFPAVKDTLVEQYLAANPIPEFRELIEQRLAEREVSNLTWVLWAYAARKDTAPPDEATDAPRRYERVLRILEVFSA